MSEGGVLLQYPPEASSMDNRINPIRPDTFDNYCVGMGVCDLQSKLTYGYEMVSALNGDLYMINTTVMLNKFKASALRFHGSTQENQLPFTHDNSNSTTTTTTTMPRPPKTKFKRLIVDGTEIIMTIISGVKPDGHDGTYCLKALLHIMFELVERSGYRVLVVLTNVIYKFLINNNSRNDIDKVSNHIQSGASMNDHSKPILPPETGILYDLIKVGYLIVLPPRMVFCGKTWESRQVGAISYSNYVRTKQKNRRRKGLYEIHDFEEEMHPQVLKLATDSLCLKTIEDVTDTLLLAMHFEACLLTNDILMLQSLWQIPDCHPARMLLEAAMIEEVITPYILYNGRRISITSSITEYDETFRNPDANLRKGPELYGDRHDETYSALDPLKKEIMIQIIIDQRDNGSNKTNINLKESNTNETHHQRLFKPVTTKNNTSSHCSSSNNNMRLIKASSSGMTSNNTNNAMNYFNSNNIGIVSSQMSGYQMNNNNNSERPTSTSCDYGGGLGIGLMIENNATEVVSNGSPRSSGVDHHMINQQSPMEAEEPSIMADPPSFQGRPDEFIMTSNEVQPY